MEERMRVMSETGQARIVECHQSAAGICGAVQRQRPQSATRQVCLQDQSVVAGAKNDAIKRHARIIDSRRRVPWRNGMAIRRTSWHRLSFKSRRIEQRRHAKGSAVDRDQADTAVSNREACEAVGMPPVKIAVSRKHGLLPVGRPWAQPAIVVMPVAFNVLDPEERHHRQIL